MAFADLIVGKWNRNLFPWFTPGSRLSGCISFVSYIKPQLTVTKKEPSSSCISFVSYIKPQRRRIQQHHHWVVYLSFPTSNHNSSLFGLEDNKLYIFRFLHQTTTQQGGMKRSVCCISFVSYIKPQLYVCHVQTQKVVYLSFPTSNHNAYQHYDKSRKVVYLSFPTSNHN